MPSSSKTPYAALNQWGATDKPKWEDHNIDNRNTDAKLQEHRTAIDGLEGSFHGPYVGEDDYWYEWDIATAQYVRKGYSVGADSTVPGPPGTDGQDGRGIVSNERTSGTGAPGTTDTYTITYTDDTTSTYAVYNGADGTGAGDMTKAVYDPNNKAADAFDMGNMTETDTAKIMTGTERTKLAGIATGAQVNTVTSVAGKTGAVEIGPADVGADPSGAAAAVQSALSTHVADDDNPHGVTAAQVGASIPPAQLTALPASGTALTDNAEYRVADPVGTYVFAWPASSFECWLRFTTDATFSITFPSGTTYIGGAPTFNASTQYEMSVKDGVVIVQEVAAA